MKEKPINIFKFPSGTKVRIKSNVDCHKSFLKGGNLVFQPKEDAKENEYTIGIEIGGAVCYEFHPSEYELNQSKY